MSRFSSHERERGDREIADRKEPISAKYERAGTDDECGCYVAHEIDEYPADPHVYIEYCPMHASSPEMADRITMLDEIVAEQLIALLTRDKRIAEYEYVNAEYERTNTNLLDRLEQQAARITDLEEQIEWYENEVADLRKLIGQHQHANEAMSERIAELERNRDKLVKDQSEAVRFLREKGEAKDERIAELEAQNVRLSDESFQTLRYLRSCADLYRAPTHTSIAARVKAMEQALTNSEDDAISNPDTRPPDEASL